MKMKKEINEKKPLGVYLHIPFCVRKCQYCDFLSFPLSDGKDTQAYVDALCEEIRCFFQEKTGYQITSIYLGGGTPSILQGEQTKQILSTLHQYGSICPEAEITTEANPGTLTMEKLTLYREAGINRLSIGLQTTVQKELSYLGRIHTYEDFLKSYKMGRKAGFENINIDLMSAIPYQTLDSWTQTLKRVLKLQPEHISAYSLIVEEETPFYDDPALSSLLPDEDTERQMYDLTRQMLKEHGYERYEVSNYARPGKECHHNLLYWDRLDYIGFGLNSASCLDDVRFSNTGSMDDYLKNPWVPLDERNGREVLSHREQMEEAMILGLRKTAGISSREFLARYGDRMEDIFGDVIRRYEKEGLLEWRGDALCFTRRGFDLSNQVLCEFLS